MASSGSGCPTMVQSMAEVEAKTIFDIPIELFENIILYTSYDQIAQMRQVCNHPTRSFGFVSGLV